MMSISELEFYFIELGLPINGQELIKKARKNAPVREVKSKFGNVITHYQSKKMSRSLVAESRSLEYSAMIGYEFNKEVIEYYAQPFKIDVVIRDSQNKKIGRLQHTPDFLIIKKDQVLVEEWKLEKRLNMLKEKTPHDLFKSGDGWHRKSAEEYFRELGITYRIRTYEDLPHVFLRNVQFLADYMDKNYPELTPEKLSAMKAIMQERSILTIQELIDAGKQPA